MNTQQQSALESLLSKHNLPFDLLVPAVDSRYPDAILPKKYAITPAFVSEATGFNQYRSPSKSGLSKLGASLEIGLIEPPVFNFDLLLQSVEFIDGRRRFSSGILEGYEAIESHIYVNLTPAMREQLELSLNSTKEPIQSADMAMFAKKLQQGIHVDDGRPLTVKEIADFIYRNSGTVSKYLHFANMDTFVRDTVRKHPEKNWYTKAVYLAKVFSEHADQRLLFSKFLEEDGPQPASLHDVKRQVEASKPFALQPVIVQTPGNSFTAKKKEYVTLVKKLGQEVNAVYHLSKVSSEILFIFRNEKTDFFSTTSLTSFKRGINELRRSFTKEMKRAHPTLEARLQNTKIPNGKNFTEQYEKFLEDNRKEDAKGELKLFGGELYLLPVEEVRPDPKQLRTKRDPKKVEELAQDIKQTFQVKPGTVVPLPESELPHKYQIVVGEGRYEAVKLAGVPYYRAFIVDELDESKKLFIQALEDLSESDTFMERARKINQHYHLVKPIYSKKLRKRYTKEQFIQDHKHLADKKTLREALEVLELPKDVQYFMDETLLTKRNGLLLGKLPKEQRFEIMYNALVKQQSSNAVYKAVSEKVHIYESGIVQSNLFGDLQSSYSKSFNQLTAKIGSVYKTVLSGVKDLEEKNLSYQVYFELGKVFERIEKLKSRW